jgi:hypothetical protein
MMSDEEVVDGKFKVSRQEWRSEEFNDLMVELDDRASVSNSKPRPRLCVSMAHLKRHNHHQMLRNG